MCMYLIDVQAIRSVVNTVRVWIKILNAMVKKIVLMVPMKFHPSVKLQLYKPLHRHVCKRFFHNIKEI